MLAAGFRPRLRPELRPVGVGVLLVLLAGAGAAIEPFYLELERQGVAERAIGAAALAARHLQVACFGMLAEPAARGRCLTHLALARAEAGDRKGFQAAFAKLLEVERQLQGYSRAILDRDLREALARRAELWVPRETLADVPAFREVTRRQEVRAIASLPAAERRAEIERRRAAEPSYAGWSVLAGELALEDGKPTEALAAVGPVLSRDPADAGARCVRGSVLAGRGSCAEAEPDLALCLPPFSPPTADAILRCALAAGDAQRATEVLESLPAELRRRDPFKRHERALRQLPRSSAAHVASEPATVEPATVHARAGGGGPPAAPPERGVLSAADAAALAKAREALASTTRAALETGFESARSVADRNPASLSAQHVAAELAYRLARWSDAVELFHRGGEVAASRPELLFYLAVSLYETGDRDAAAAALQLALPGMSRTPFVESYVKKILGDGAARKP